MSKIGRWKASTDLVHRPLVEPSLSRSGHPTSSVGHWCLPNVICTDLPLKILSPGLVRRQVWEILEQFFDH